MADRIARMVADLEKAAGAGAYAPEETVQQQAQFNATQLPNKKRERARKRHAALEKIYKLKIII